MKKNKILSLAIVAALSTSLIACGNSSSNGSSVAEGSDEIKAANSGEVIELTNVSYDPTRELYAAYNEVFAKHYQDEFGQTVEITQSHGGSGKQALEVANGLEADVVTLALEGDVQVVADAGLIDDGFTSEYELDSSPYTSTIVFLVRSGNPKKIYDWNDLIREDVGVITPNPKTSGGAMWNYLAAWYYFEQQGQNDSEILDSIKQLYANVVVLDSGARGATTSFVENKQGDVLIAWENEAFLSLKEYPGEYEIVVPSVSILCQPTVAVVDEVAKKHGTADVAKEYLGYLYSDEAQEIEAQNFYRPSTKSIYDKYVFTADSNTITEIPADGKWINDNVNLTDINHFGGWAQARADHFADGANFDSIYEQ
ncbi:sulfate ABC transporter substrate-binding protein [Pseudobutyrivibrio xylanivorans]|uniref:Sulfate transport system substrate-binding protein n=1 Tax=Pseudobutyrivibrio xylanivorans DSM 14809 TaxID=1123012 RepID=A0A1M6AF79_PSEXY|nr:sulfate ABC transporter substrate-binding protein [Pseudobutyrivibrio xylanivorans]SHI35067.1 sulfate transport system substrate-binding protein [Pseudobutyrivibrio xylanivorans DSM 14809]